MQKELHKIALLYLSQIKEVNVGKKRRRRRLSPSIFHFTCLFLSCSTHLLPHSFLIEHPHTILSQFLFCLPFVQLHFCRSGNVVHFNQLKNTSRLLHCFLTHVQNVVNQTKLLRPEIVWYCACRITHMLDVPAVCAWYISQRKTN